MRELSWREWKPETSTDLRGQLGKELSKCEAHLDGRSDRAWRKLFVFRYALTQIRHGLEYNPLSII